MDLKTLHLMARVVFLFSVGLNYLAPGKLLATLAGVSALILGILVLFGS